MKLYATTISERESRPAKKGGNEYIDIMITNNNASIARLRIRPARAGSWEEKEGKYILDVYYDNEMDDRRRKIPSYEHETIKDLHKDGMSIRAIARKYNVDKRLIQFILFPERLEVARKDYKERRKDGRYYDKDVHRLAMRNWRKRKKELGLTM